MLFAGLFVLCVVPHSFKLCGMGINEKKPLSITKQKLKAIETKQFI